MIRKILLSSLLSLFFAFTNAQNGGVGINILNPDSSAILQLETTEKGFALPRLTTSEMNAIQNPILSLMIYNTEDSLVHYWNGDCWLKTYQKNCYECEFTMSIDNASASINHVPSDSAFANITVTQINGNQDITLIPMAILPTDITMSLTNNVIDSFGVANLSVYANIFATPGSYPIIIQAICGSTVQFLTFNVIVEPCLYVPIASNQTDFNLTTFGSLPTATAVCVIAEVFDNIEINASTTSNAAFDVGGLHPNSHLGLINHGSILGRGGNGGSAGNLLAGSFGEDGFPGGNALELTTKTTFDLQGEIYAGGGGGAGVGTGLSFSILGNTYFIGFGYGGGGGVVNGLGGTATVAGGGTVIGQLSPGTDATSGINAIPGVGAGVSAGFDIAALLGIPLLYADITGALDAGDGGDFAQAGQGSAASLGIDIGLGFPWPIGNVTLYQGTFPISTAIGGLPGMAIKTNGNTTVNLVTPNLYIKGVVAP